MNTLRGTLSRFGWTNDARPSRGPAEFGGSDDKYASGIGPSGPTPTMGNGSSSSHDRDARLAKITFWLRISSLVLCFCSLICAIVAATFQKKWIGGPSGLTGFLLFVNVAFLLISGVFTIMPWLVERETGGKKVAEFERALREDRLGIVGTGFCLILGIIVCVTQTISTLTAPACKDVNKDPHLKSTKTGNQDDYKGALPGFCNTKRAETAFLWLVWIVFVALGVLFFLEFKRGRKAGPRIPPFVHPGGHSDGGAFQPLGDDEFDDDDDPHAHAPTYDSQQPQRYPGYDDAAGQAPYETPMIPGRYGGGGGGVGYSNPVSNIEARYGMQTGQHQHQHQHQPYAAYDPSPAATYDTTPNPFADALAQAQPLSSTGPAPGYRPSYDYGAYSGGVPPAQYEVPQRRY